MVWGGLGVGGVSGLSEGTAAAEGRGGVDSGWPCNLCPQSGQKMLPGFTNFPQPGQGTSSLWSEPPVERGLLEWGVSAPVRVRSGSPIVGSLGE